MNPSERTDGDAVAAVRNGESERYRDLVERYERKVFAVAWARLGDSDMAEEATQETFIRAYRKLGLLNEASRFGPWLLAIARNVSINLGLRRRHELNKRQRWAVLQETDSPAAGPVESVPTETLRQVLAELPAQHRECLVLFYLERKSIAEAAGLLALSETAFKTRLHRARAALRQRLEVRLDESLERLGPSQPLAPAIMALVSGQSIGGVAESGLAGMLAKGSTAFLKIVPFHFILLGMLLAGVIPALWLSRLEQNNYRESDGFRARIYQMVRRRALLFTLILMPLVWIGSSWLATAWGMAGYLVALGIVLIVGIIASARLLVIHRSRMVIGNLAGAATIGVGLAANEWLGMPRPLFHVFMGVFFGWIAWSFRDLPLRMDYSLFLRAHQGLIPPDPEDHPMAKNDLPSDTPRLGRRELFAFARFLGQHWLVADYRLQRENLRLRVPPASPGFRAGLFPWIWRDCSTLALAANGAVQAHLDPRDADALARFGAAPVDREVLESSVQRAVQEAWTAFRAGDLRGAEQHLGQQPSEWIFRRRPHDAAFWRRAFLGGAAVLMIVLGVAGYWQERFHPPQFRHLQAVAVGEAAVRAALRGLERNPKAEPAAWQLVDLWSGAVIALPPKALFADSVWRRVAAQVASWPESEFTDDQREALLRRLMWDDRLQRALASGFLTRQDLEERGVTSRSLREYLTSLPLSECHSLLTLASETTVINGERVAGWAVEKLTWRLHVLEEFGCLDLVERTKIIDEITRCQVLPGHTVASERPARHRRDLRGLFQTRGWDPLRETYGALSCLSLLGGLDRIDRESCVHGILRFHLRQGLFGPPPRSVSMHSAGGAQGTFYGYESLRMLEALDGVRSLESWVFRTDARSHPASNDVVTASELEAWLYQQRLNNFLAKRKSSPATPAPSLLSGPLPDSASP